MPLSALRPHAIQLALVLGCILAGTPSAQADSDLQKFEAAIPPQAKLGFAEYQSCGLLTGIDKKNEAASFQDAEIAIAKDCKKHLVEADRDLAQTGMSADERAKVIERFSFLALTERRLRAEGKAIPGYEESPETAKFMACDRKMHAAKAVYVSCIDEALRNLIPLSRDTSDVVADAAVGMCSAKRSDVVTSLTCFSISASEANATVSQLDQQLRSSALGKVAAARAAMRQREMQEQAPNAVPSPAQRPGPPKSKQDI